jgi:hypothetical protein
LSPPRPRLSPDEALLLAPLPVPLELPALFELLALPELPALLELLEPPELEPELPPELPELEPPLELPPEPELPEPPPLEPLPLELLPLDEPPLPLFPPLEKAGATVRPSARAETMLISVFLKLAMMKAPERLMRG